MLNLQAQVINYNWPTTAPKSSLYEIKVTQDGQTYNIYPHLSTPYKESNFYWPDRDLSDGNNNGLIGYITDRTMTFGTFAFEGEITIEVTKLYGQPASRVEIAPKSFGVNPTSFDGNTVRFNINHDMSAIAKYIAVDFISDDNLDSDSNNGFHVKNSVMIFADKPETGAPNPNDSNVKVFGEDTGYETADIIYFRKGDYNIHDYYNAVYGEDGQMPFTKNNQTIYLEPGTFIRGAFHGKGYDDITLKGRAIVTGQNYPYHWFRDQNDKKSAFINFIGCDNVHVEGIIIENPSHHTIPSSKNTVHKNIKIIGWSYNQDGIRPSSGGLSDQIFIKSQDDYDYARDPHVVQNSVFWPTHNGACGMIGWNNLGTGYAEYKNMAYINSETKSFNKNNTGIIGSQADDGIKLTNNYLEDLVIEDDHAYLVNVTLSQNGALDAGYLNNFTFKNITTEYPFRLSNKQKAIQRMNGLPNNWLDGWNFINVIIDGVLLTFDNHQDYFNMNLQGVNGGNFDNDNYVSNVTFGTEGNIYEIATTVGAGGSVHPSGVNGKIACIGGKDQAISIVPNNGYRIKSITIDGVEKYVYGSATKTARMQSVRFSQVSDNHSIAVTFEAGDDYFNQTTLGVDDTNLNKSTIKLYPNPVKNLLHITNVSTDVKLEIFDTLGRKVLSGLGNQINVSNLKKGLYFMKVDTSPIGKFVKN
ncbi:T9SS type A sorting domain-containing protein [Lutibacter sp. HS1-25]|uniref:T9SS type A sorting domain-containing protein n=1 Tax=Lutibacter sp. HS1-25 TaxID=2485000 RepID=UPI0013E94182|nr:T9SS type A sorting domain-containing protein [Lutibacter sp. HS1-25]